MTDAPGFTLFEQEIDDAVVHIPVVEHLYSAVTYGVQQVIVDVIGLQVFKRLLVHGDRVFARIVAEVRELGGNVILVSRMPFQGDTRRFLRPSLYVYRGGVEIVYAVCEGMVNQFVYSFLVNHVALPVFRGDGGPAHAAISEKGYFIVA